MKPRMILNLLFACLIMGSGVSASFADEEKTQALIQVLQSDSPVFEKARACQQLGEFGTKASIPALAALLTDEILSTYARTALERIAGPESAAAIRDAVPKTDGKLLVGLVQSLGALRDDQTVPMLIKLTENADATVAQAAILSLGRITNEESVQWIRKALATGPEAIRNDAAAACLLAAEKQRDAGHRVAANAIYEAVLQSDVSDRYRIGATLGAILTRGPDQVPFLTEQLRSDDPGIRDVALLAVRYIPSDALADALHSEILKAPLDQQMKLITAVRDCHNADSARLIRSLLDHDSADVRLTALNVLVAISGSEAADALLETVSNHRNPEELNVALNNLERMPGSEVDHLILNGLNASSSSEAKVHLIELLGSRQVVAATDELLKLAKDSNTDISIAAYQALTHLVTSDHIHELIDMIKNSSNASVRNAAESTLYEACINSSKPEVGGELILRELKTASNLTDSNSWIKVLAMLGYQEALSTITPFLANPDPEVAAQTIDQLGRWPNPAPIEALFEIVGGNSSPRLRQSALAAVIQLATRAADRRQASADVLVEWFQQAGRSADSVQPKRAIISGLGRVQHMESIRALVSYLNDPEVQVEAAHAIINAAQPLMESGASTELETVLSRIEKIDNPALQERMEELIRK